MSLPQIHFSGTYQDKDCPIALVEYKDYNLDNYIKYNDYIDYISENKERTFEELSFVKKNITKLPNSTGYYNHTDTNLFSINTNDDYMLLDPSSFLITDILSPYKEKFPLFYQHRLQYDLYSDQKNPGKYIKIRLNGTDILNEDSYVVEFGNNTLKTSGDIFNDSIIWSTIKPAGSYFRCRVLLPYEPDVNSYYDIEYDAYLNNNSVIKRKELINRNPIYKEGQAYNLISSGVTLTPSSLINVDYLNGSGYIYLQKEYKSRVFIKPFDNNLITSGTTNWNLTFNTGKFILKSGIFRNDNIIYHVPSTENTVIISGEYPKLLSQNILQTTKYPLCISTSGYPSYEITDGFEMYINDIKLENKQIDSIDYEKGFIKTKRNFNLADNIKLIYNINNRDNFIIKNLDLNPKNFSLFQIANDNLSLALTPSGTGPTGISFFRTLDNQKGNFITSTYGWESSSDSSENYSGILDSDSILIGEVNYKNLPEDIIKITDCRRLGGGLSNKKNSDEKSWYYDKGRWDGEIFQSNSSIAIQIPSGVINYFINKFANNNTYDEDNYNEQILLGNDPSGVLNELNFSELKYYNATKDAYKYITESVEKYLPIGTEYLLMNENQKIYNIIL